MSCVYQQCNYSRHNNETEKSVGKVKINQTLWPITHPSTMSLCLRLFFAPKCVEGQNQLPFLLLYFKNQPNLPYHSSINNESERFIDRCAPTFTSPPKHFQLHTIRRKLAFVILLQFLTDLGNSCDWLFLWVNKSFSSQSLQMDILNCTQSCKNVPTVPTGWC